MSTALLDQWTLRRELGEVAWWALVFENTGPPSSRIFVIVGRGVQPKVTE